MLQRTNVFPKDVSELKYASAWPEEDISLLGCVEDEIKKYNHRFRGRSERNLQIVYRCIGAAMAVYIEIYPAAFSFKQQTKEFFLLWLEKIPQIASASWTPAGRNFVIIATVLVGASDSTKIGAAAAGQAA